MIHAHDPCRAALIGALVACGLLFSGCAARPAWNDEPPAATLAYWMAEAPAARVEGADYGALWDAADEARRRFGFEAAMSDYRGGVLTTRPMVSPQFFEVWRDELRTLGDRAESSLATVRRRVRFEFGRSGDRGFWVEPVVLVERLSLGERRITNAIDFRGVLGPGSEQGTRLGRRGEPIPSSYWYAVGRDEALERSLANRIARRANARLTRSPQAEPPAPAASAAPG